VASNIIPKQVAQMVKAYARGDLAVALRLHERYYSLIKDLFIETNPSPIKAAAALLGQMEEELRLPMVPISAKSREILKATLRRCGVLKT